MAAVAPAMALRSRLRYPRNGGDGGTFQLSVDL